jgi:hypothetical protein
MNEEPTDVSPELALRWPSDPALQLLADNLSRIFTTQYSGPVESNRREQYASALVQFTDFLKANDFPSLVVRRFIDLVVAIRDLDKGTIAEFLTPVPAWNRHVDPRNRWLARAHAAIVLEMLANDSPGQLKAQSKDIANWYARLFPHETVTPAAVKKWRERFKNCEIKDSIAQNLFNNRDAVIETVRGALIRTGEEPTPSDISNIILSLAVTLVSPVAAPPGPPTAG